jgi:hypothetical protein
MQAHLDSGCKECGETLRTWQGVVALAKEEGQFVPPEDVVRVTKSQFVPAAGLMSGHIRLLFDSLLQPAVAGVRGLVSGRQFLFETDDLYIDLRLSPQAERLSLVGQIMDRGQTKQAVKGLPISLHRGDLRLTDTNTNEFGEFQFEVDAQADMCIWIARSEKQLIVLPLYGVHVRPLNKGGSA